LNTLTKSIGIFTAYLVGTIVILSTVVYFTQWDMPTSMSLILIMCSAMGAGMSFAKDHNRLPEKPEKRKFAGIASLIAAFLPLLFFWIILLAIGAGLTDIYPELADVPNTWWLGIGVFVLVLSYAVTYYFFGMGAKSHLKAVEKQAAKGKKT